MGNGSLEGMNKEIKREEGKRRITGDDNNSFLKKSDGPKNVEKQ